MRTLHSHKFLQIIFLLALAGLGAISACTSRATRSVAVPTESASSVAALVNINTASASDLEKLPHLGAVLAERIIEHRNRYGPFRRREHILAIEGISEKRFRELEQFIDIK